MSLYSLRLKAPDASESLNLNLNFQQYSGLEDKGGSKCFWKLEFEQEPGLRARKVTRGDYGGCHRRK